MELEEPNLDQIRRYVFSCELKFYRVCLSPGIKSGTLFFKSTDQHGIGFLITPHEYLILPPRRLQLDFYDSVLPLVFLIRICEGSMGLQGFLRGF